MALNPMASLSSNGIGLRRGLELNRKLSRLKSWHDGVLEDKGSLFERRKSLSDIQSETKIDAPITLPSRGPLDKLLANHLRFIDSDTLNSSHFRPSATDTDSDTQSDFENDDDHSSFDTSDSDSETPKIKTESPTLLRSNARIRKGYLASLGIGNAKPKASIGSDPSMGVHAKRAAMASARTRRKPPSMRMKLKEAEAQSPGFGQALIRKITSWMTTEEENAYNAESRVVNRGEARRLKKEQEKEGEESEKRVFFLEETDVHFVPSRVDISPRNRARMWHTREEFIDMVVRNMDQVEEEMLRKAEAKRRLEDLKNHPPPALPRRKSRSKPE